MARFGKYELLQRIGEGGMAEVHLARRTGAFGTDKLLVLKRILPELASTERIARMFVEEARLALGLNHANIVQVYEADEAEGVAFYVMEFLQGRDVRELMREVKRQRQRVPLDHAVAIVLSTCAALHYAHELVGQDGRPLGIVHRDVSPHNVFVLYDGVVKVIDFGIAKIDARGDRTATGMLKGKFGYMSPEQCLQQPLDRRSDVFGVGILLWELTTGQRLFKAPSDYQMVKAIVETSATPPRRVDPAYPPELEAIVMRALKRDRGARFATSRELELELQAFARASGLDLSPASLASYMARVFERDVQTWRRALMTGALPDLDPRTEDLDADVDLPPPSAPGAPPLALADGTKSATVTETIAAERPGRRPAAVLAVVAALAAAAAGAVLVSRRNDAPPPTATADAPATSASVAAPVAVDAELEPTPAAADAGSAEAQTTAAPRPTASVAPPAPRKWSPPPRRPKAPPTPSPKAAPSRDPDAPLPR